MMFDEQTGDGTEPNPTARGRGVAHAPFVKVPAVQTPEKVAKSND